MMRAELSDQLFEQKINKIVQHFVYVCFVGNVAVSVLASVWMIISCDYSD